MMLTNTPTSLGSVQRRSQAGVTRTSLSPSRSSCGASGRPSAGAWGACRPRRTALMMASQTAEASTSTAVRASTATKVKQDWAITIASTGTGAVDADDDGRRLKLTLLDADGNTLFVGSTDDKAAPWAEPDIDYATKGWSRSGVVSVEVPPGVRPAVLKVEKLDVDLSDKDKASEQEKKKAASGAVDYIYSITVKGSTAGDKFKTKFVGQEWIASRKAPGSSRITAAKVLFAASSLPQETTDFLRELRAIELLKIRGEVSVDPAVNSELQQDKRTGAENIYDYQTYNDLGSADAQSDLYRPTLGGSEFPYPRRLATHLATDDTTEQIDPEPWLPYNERFTFSKKTDFTGGTVSAAVPAIFGGLGHLAHQLLNPQAVVGAIQEAGPKPLAWLKELGNNYSSFAEVDEHYSWNALPNPLCQAQGTSADGSQVDPSDTAASGEAGATSRNPLDSWLNKKDARRGPFAPDHDDNTPPTPGFGKVAISTLLGMASQAVMGNLKPEMKQPRVLVNRPADVCFQDEEFGRQFLAGFNPSVISALTQTPQQLGSAIREEDVAGDLADGETIASLVAAAKAGQKPRLYMVDCWAYTAFFTQDWNDTDKVLHAGRALLYLKQDESGKDTALIPVAIELAVHPNCANPPEPTPATAPTSGVVYSRHKLLANGDKNVWDVAKLVFRSLDLGVHQLISHWLRCHAAIEPFLIALRRCISSAHPVYKLLLPHFRYTMAINAAGRGALINAGGVIERTFAPGPFAMRLSSVIYGQAWRFESQALPVDLKNRGMVDASGKPHLSYPYAEDGLRIWDSLERYFSAYLDLYYKDDGAVLADTEVQDWWTEVTTKAHPDLPDQSHWGVKDPTAISSRAELVRVLVTIAWTASAHHAAVNFGQYDMTSYPLNAPSLIRRPIPRKPSDAEWKALASSSGKKYEKEVLTYINSPTTNLLVALTVNLLSTHAQDEHTVDEPNTLLTDDAAQELNAAFIKEMKQLEADIVADHHRPNNWTRAEPGPGRQPTYSTCLIPGSTAGLTMRGVPYSVSI